MPPSGFSTNDVLRAVNRFQKTRLRRGREDRVPLDKSFEGEVMFAAQSLTALFSAQVAMPIRFKVSIGDDPAPPGDFRLEYSFKNVDLTICRVPQALNYAPAQFRGVLMLFMCCQAYIQTVEREFEHDWGVEDPTRRMLMDALAVCDESRELARRSLWN